MNPEIDKIASAALDGEATSEELARVSDDPSFLAAKSELEAASQFVSQPGLPLAPEGLARTQISMAMEQFRADAAQKALIAAKPSSETSSRAAASRAQTSKWSMPNWLVPALFSVAVLGGLGIAASNLPGSGSNDSAAIESADSALTAETTEAMSDDAMNLTTMEAAEAMEEAATEAMEDDSEGADMDVPATTAAVGPLLALPAPIDLSGATFEAAKSVSPDEVAERATRTPPLDPDLYDRCGPEHGYEPPAGALELVSVVPFIRDSEPAEVLVYETSDAETQITVILSESCEVLDQS